MTGVDIDVTEADADELTPQPSVARIGLGNIVTIVGHRDWTSHEVTARVPDDANIVMFGIFLAGRGRIELRHAELTRGA